MTLQMIIETRPRADTRRQIAHSDVRGDSARERYNSAVDSTRRIVADHVGLATSERADLQIEIRYHEIAHQNSSDAADGTQWTAPRLRRRRMSLDEFEQLDISVIDHLKSVKLSLGRCSEPMSLSELPLARALLF